MPTADATTDDDTTTQTSPPPASPPAGGYDPAMLNTLLQQLMQPPQQPQPMVPQTSSSEGRSWASLLGEAAGGGEQYGTPQQREAGGLRALMSLGTNMMANSGWAPLRTPFGQILATGLQGAQQSVGESQSVVAAQAAAQQDWAQKQQEMNLQRIKVALPLLTLQTQMQQAAAARNLAGGGGGAAPGTNVAQGGSIGVTGSEAPINAAGDSATRKAGEGGPPAPGTPAAAEAQRVHDFWISQGYTEPQVAGILAGGPGSESNFSPTASGDKGTSYGLYQHHGDRLAAMQKYFGLSGDQMPSADQQNQYAAYEISPKGPLASVGTQLKAATTPADAAAVWTRSFGVPADKTEIGRRALGASRFADIYGKPQGAPATAAAPTAATTAPPGSGFGVSAFNTPTSTVLPVPASQATAPNTTDIVPPVPTPQMAAARALAVKAGRPMPIAGTDGLFANPDGSVGPGPGGGGLGRRADISPIVGGMQTAQTTMPPSSVAAAGPAAGGGTTPTVSAPAPAGAFGGAAFTTAPAQKVGAPAGPAPQVTTPAPVTAPTITAATPSTVQPNPDIKAGDVTIRHPGSFADYSAQEHVPPPQTEVYNPNLTAPQLAAFAARRQQVDFDRQNVANLPFAQQPEAVAKWKAEDAALTADQQNAAQAKAQAAAAATEKYEEGQRTAIQTRYDNATKAYSDAAQGQLTSQNKVKEINATSDAQAAGKALEGINTATAGAQDVVNQAEVARTLSQAAGTPGFIAMWPKVADNFVRMGLLSQDEVQQLGAQRGLDAATNKLILALKSQAGFSRFSNMDLQFLQNTAPSSFTPEQLRTPMLAFIQTTAQRQLQYGQLVNSMHASGMPVWQAQQEADKQLGHVLQQPPAFDNITDPNAKLAAQGQWVSQNVTPGSFYLKPNGQLGIRGGGQQQPQGGQ